MSAQDERNRGVQRGQWLLFSVLAGVVLLLAVLWIGAGGGNNAPPLLGIDAQLAVPGEAEAGWVRLSETRLGGNRGAGSGHRNAKPGAGTGQPAAAGTAPRGRRKRPHRSSTARRR